MNDMREDALDAAEAAFVAKWTERLAGIIADEAYGAGFWLSLTDHDREEDP